MGFIDRSLRYEIALFPYLALINCKRADKEFIANAKVVRDFARKLINDRR